jgi:hypothetical protein
MPGNPEANYKAIQRFLEASDPKEALLRLYQEALLSSWPIPLRSLDLRRKRQNM